MDTCLMDAINVSIAEICAAAAVHICQVLLSGSSCPDPFCITGSLLSYDILPSSCMLLALNRAPRLTDLLGTINQAESTSMCSTL